MYNILPTYHTACESLGGTRVTFWLLLCSLWGMHWGRRNSWVSITVAIFIGRIFCEVYTKVGPIMWEMKKYYLESRSRGIPCMK